MTEIPFALSGSTLITGPSNVGKTRLTARGLEAWVERHGSDGVVVLDFGPEFEHEGRILGRRLSRFGALPDGVWSGVLDAHAPRAEGKTDAESVRLAADNAVRARRLLSSAPPEPQAVFVNDASIPFQHTQGDPTDLLEYCDGATVAVVNAFKSDELGADDQVSQREREVLSVLESWADRVIRLSRDGDTVTGCGER